MQVYQQYVVDILPLIKTFLANFANFSASNFIKNKTLAHVSSCDFCKKIFKSPYFVEHLRMASSNDIIFARFFCKIYSVAIYGCLKRTLLFHLNHLNHHLLDFVKYL